MFGLFLGGNQSCCEGKEGQVVRFELVTTVRENVLSYLTDFGGPKMFRLVNQQWTLGREACKLRGSGALADWRLVMQPREELIGNQLLSHFSTFLLCSCTSFRL